ncbi:ubiquitin-conjugating enzyme E2 J1 isoform X2 [Sphaeramia orbicularis]|uniref:Ubiquitin-conjugating enzyme E2 J1 n=1 Tax=Sphaeramia orbicularis TaxID=375764 RepID=A0A673BKM7_9TELE|nr:ubiquitin-conjugating enzyme E2 J1 isoform X2 [Sphaeramia orbicularis]
MSGNMENKYNLKSPAVKRLMKEAVELREPTEHYHAQPLEDNLFEWHFSVRGPPDSDFDGGVYHGRIVLPPEYPMKPPSIILLTPNGRFEVGKKICLSISGHHPETWQPSWSIRTALLAIIGFMPTKGEGAIGSLDYTPEERKALAKKSVDFCCDICGCSMSSALLPLSANSRCSTDDHKAKELAQQINFKAESSLSRQASECRGSGNEPPTPPQGDTTRSAGPEHADRSALDEQAEASPASRVEGPPTPPVPTTSRPLSPRQRRTQHHSQQGQRDSREAPNRPAFAAAAHQPQEESHAGSAVLIVVLTLALAALIFRRIYLAHEYKFDYEL